MHMHTGFWVVYIQIYNLKLLKYSLLQEILNQLQVVYLSLYQFFTCACLVSPPFHKLKELHRLPIKTSGYF